MAEKGSEPMPVPTVHLLITLRGPVWRVRILSGGTIRWKCYCAEDYPTPEAVARRCAAGLVASEEAPEDKATSCDTSDNDNGFRPAHGLPLLVRWECWGTL